MTPESANVKMYNYSSRMFKQLALFSFKLLEKS